jgi:predicted GNAT superfamily acetyltransferase
MDSEIQIRECVTLDELTACVELQREVFGLPDIEISPVRHLIVSRSAGGFILGAFDGDDLVGFVLSVPAFLRNERAFYSHMTAVKRSFQSSGIGSNLKWAQRSEALARGVRFLKWTFEPWRARNAYFNLEKLGAVVSEYHPNFYGIDYTSASVGEVPIGLASDRLFAEWRLECDKVAKLAAGDGYTEAEPASLEISVTPDWSSLVAADATAAIAEQARLRDEFEAAFAAGMIARGFARDNENPRYLLYRK